jgi:hypothetical protein
MSANMAVILVGDNGYTETEPELLSEREGTAFGFHQPWWKGVSFFHKNGTRYEVVAATPVTPLPPLSKLLAATVHNPRIVVRYEYRAAGHYGLNELKDALSEAIFRDDDILTQFHGADELSERLGGAASFDDLVKMLQFAATEGES